ncbi:hypothetical protein KEJ18_06005 [Candidatus Bathyarchaeota archaeon]|nr:hypothetical protein [Candidatus Bathyarchaeota archaeon]
MSAPLIQQTTSTTQGKTLSNNLKVGAALLTFSLVVSWFQLNQTGTPTYGIGGYWGTIRYTAFGIGVSTIFHQIADALARSLVNVLGALLNLCFIILGLAALFSIIKYDAKTLKYVSTALLITYITSFVVTFIQEATISNWLKITTSTFYIKFGDLPMGLAIFFFLTESFMAQDETTVIQLKKPLPITSGTRVVRCHICPLREVCKEANVIASLRLDYSPKAKFEENLYAEMQRVTMNCPLKKNIS